MELYIRNTIMISIVLILLSGCGFSGQFRTTANSTTPKVIEATTTPQVTAEAFFGGTRVTYVGNSGFLITVGEKKVLIDGLFSGFHGVYQLPLNVQSLLVHALPPFDDIDLIIATHNHGDHFSASMVQTHMQNNPQAMFVSTSQVTNQIKGFDDRVITLEGSAGNPAQKEINGIQVEAIYLFHDIVASGETEIMNQGYVINLDGVTVFHTGDMDASLLSPEKLKEYDFPGKQIDIAFIQHFYLSDLAFRSFYIDVLQSKYIVPSHYKLTAPINTEIIENNYPGAVIFTEELQNWVMPH